MQSAVVKNPRSRLSFSVLDLIEESYKTAPGRIAVLFQNEELTYGELDHRVNNLAHYLKGLGVGRGTLVALCVTRSISMVVGLLSILKSGAAYVPMDPDFPRDRLEFMLEDSQAAFILTEQNLAERFPTGNQTIILLDAVQPSNESGPKNILPSIDPNDLAYVIYTSGSTGRPKGVMIPHSALSNVLQSFVEEPGISSDDMLLAVTTLSFDIAGLELYLPLIAGARVAIVPQSVARNPQQLSRALERYGATIMQATPATWKMLLRSGWKGLPTLKALCGGETLHRDLADSLMSAVGSLWNLYGPTETTIWSTVEKVRQESGFVPIGHPVANTQIRILDERGNEVLPGEAGELCIGGAGLARGYWNRPELTQERFIPDRLSSSGAFLYRTGDQARYQTDGRLEYLGRKDNQVKLFGFRVELEEIEAALRQHAGVRECVVVAHGAGSENPQLIAYFTSDETGNKPNSEQLRTSLRKVLPPYMVPSFYRPVEQLPLTANGKIDRKALSNLPLDNPVTAAKSNGALSDLEAELLKIFEEVLSVRCVLPTDNFFDLGGHSLLAVTLFSRIESSLGKKLPLAEIFQAPTARGLAAALNKEQASQAWSPLVPIQPLGTSLPFFCVHALGSNLLRYRSLANLLGPDQPFFGFQSSAVYGDRIPHERVEDIAAEYVSEIIKAEPRTPYHLGGWSFGGIVAFEMAQQLKAKGLPVGLLALFDTFFPGMPTYFSRVKARRTFLSRVDREIAELLGRSPKERVARTLSLARLVLPRQARSKAPRHGVAGPIEGALPQTLLKIETANSRAQSLYVPKPYPGRVVLFWGSEWGLRAYHDKRLGWSEVAEHGLELHVVPGHHKTMFEMPNVAILAQKLGQSLKRSGD